MDKIALYFSTDLEAKKVAFNIPLTVSKSDPGYVDPKLFAPNLIKAFKVLRENGAYEDRVMRSVIALTESQIRVRDCNGCGLQVVFHPNGNYGPCQAFLVNDEEVAGNVYDEGPRFVDNEVFKRWAKRSPYLIDTCLRCPVLASCGGGCAYTAKMANGDINTPDTRICDYSINITRWLINEYSKNV